jgi:hypothetical protein
MPDVIHTNPLWRYEDARGVERLGHFEGFTDFGGTDVPYRFRDCASGELSVVSGTRLRRAERIWHDCERCVRPSCPRCGQTTVAEAEVCASCREADRQPQGESVRLFTPAPNQISGQLSL